MDFIKDFVFGMNIYEVFSYSIIFDNISCLPRNFNKYTDFFFSDINITFTPHNNRQCFFQKEKKNTTEAE